MQETLRRAWLPSVKEGSQAAWPICLGYLPIGLAFGVLAHEAGLHPWQVGLMSIVVFAGSSQFIAVAMLQAGATAGAIVATTFMVNLRHLLMSSALAPHFRHESRGYLSAFAYGLTDESFAVHAAQLRNGVWDRSRGLALNQAANLAWVGSTVAGAYAGNLVPSGAFGSDYALVSMFLCLLVFQIRSRVYLLTALLSGTLALAFSLLLRGNLHVVLASMLAAALGVALRRRARRPASVVR